MTNNGIPFSATLTAAIRCLRIVPSVMLHQPPYLRPPLRFSRRNLSPGRAFGPGGTDNNANPHQRTSPKQDPCRSPRERSGAGGRGVTSGHIAERLRRSTQIRPEPPSLSVPPAERSGASGGKGPIAERRWVGGLAPPSKHVTRTRFQRHTRDPSRRPVPSVTLHQPPYLRPPLRSGRRNLSPGRAFGPGGTDIAHQPIANGATIPVGPPSGTQWSVRGEGTHRRKAMGRGARSPLQARNTNPVPTTHKGSIPPTRAVCDASPAPLPPTSAPLRPQEPFPGRPSRAWGNRQSS